MNRVERQRLLREKLGRLALDPIARRLLKNYRKFGPPAAEVFTQADDGTGRVRYYDVFSARLWCCGQPIVPVAFDWSLVAALEARGAIDQSHIAGKEFPAEAAPVIICREAFRDEGVLIDGAHRYVLFARDRISRGLASQDCVIPAYVLEPNQWRQFVVPPKIADAFCYGEQTASSLPSEIVSRAPSPSPKRPSNI